MIEITEKREFDELLQRSQTETIIVFKHSTRCPISSRAKTELEKFLENHPEYTSRCFLVHVVESRSLSNYVEEITGIKHQSPQLLILKDGKVTHHGSHFSITTQKISEWVHEH